MFKQNEERPIFVKMLLKVSLGWGEEFATMMHESVSQGTWSVQRIIGYVIKTKRLGWCALQLVTPQGFTVQGIVWVTSGARVVRFKSTGSAACVWNCHGFVE